jgi:hypothetical protein
VDRGGLLTGDIEDRREWLLGLATKASWAAADAEVPYTSREVYETLFAGLDEPFEQRQTG